MTEGPPDREKIAEAKGVCAGCGSDLVEVGPTDGEKRGFAEFECSSERCGYREIRLFGANYYDYAED